MSHLHCHSFRFSPVVMYRCR
ncbi:CRISPR-associated DxTHG motif protein [Clostridiales Family XIII bacterium WCA-MUC-591-APC-3H]|uniref:CRISPR-associated DxTHG motif protein n=1 Tax=Hornefia butyriciproducens TaxID=2652293 RepID=A0A6L5Y535_9FIRM|nr:CRISPR-associated DxTHG motif protein [Hornefia butyriciproducens]